MVVLKSQTEGVLEEQRGENASITAYQLAIALERSDSLRRALDIDQSIEVMVRQGKTDDPWLDLVKALKQVQRKTKTLTTRFTSWEDAKEWLASEVGVSLRKEGDEKQASGKNSLQTYKFLMGKIVDQVMRSYTMKNLKLRMSERENQEIANHRSAGEELEQFEAHEEEFYQESISVQAEARLPTAVKEAEERMIAQERDEEARRIAASLLRPLTEEQQEVVDDAIYGIGPTSETMAQVDNDIVVRESMQRLRPGQWLNDEVIHYFLIMLGKRDEELCAQDSSRLRCHFFKSFFMTKILNEGHANPNVDGTYEYRNVKRWSKKVPGKDIFNLDKIIFPINQGNAHWICGVVFMQEKRIQMYDSLGGDGRMYLEAIFRYIQDEHKDKKKEPLADIKAWRLVTTERACPSQRNGKLLPTLFTSGLLFSSHFQDANVFSFRL